MAVEWRDTTLGEFLTLQRGHDLPDTARRLGTVPVLGAAGQNGFHDTAIAKGPGIVLGRSGASFGQVHYCKKDFWPHNTGLYVTDFRGNDPRFAFYFLKAINFSRYNSGSAQPSLNRNFIYPIEVRIPGPDEQRAIAHILGALDDKIELNQRMNETLENMARVLFKSWFVNFDPVRAKIKGDDLNVRGSIGDIFPSELEESEIGKIPRGWTVCGLDEIARFLNGLALQKYPARDSAGLPVIKIAQLRTGSTEDADIASSEIPSDYIVNDGDVLFSWSGSLECVLWAGGKGALNQHLFKVTSSRYEKWFHYLWIHHHLEEFRHIAASKATTMGHIQRHHLSAAKVVIPTTDFLTEAGKHIAPIINSIISNKLQARSLREIRDALLPKLVSGEVLIENPDRIIGSVT
jgi:type I restriction enzyme S subunit